MRRRLFLIGFAAAFALGAQPAHAATGSISGTVYDDGGRALADICVSAYGPPDGYGDIATSAPDGTYTLSVEPGSFHIEFWDCNHLGYPSQWWDHKMQAPGDLIIVADGVSMGGIDASLTRGTKILGYAQDRDGTPLRDICIDADSTDPPFSAHTVTAEDGWGGFVVPLGTYVVRFTDCSADPQFVTQWFDNKHTRSEASLVHIDGDDLETYVTATMTTDKPDASISYVNAQFTNSLSRTVTVIIQDLSSVPADGTLLVEVCPKTVGQCHPIASEDMHLDGGANITREWDWDTTTWVGDAIVTAAIHTEFDLDPSNNEMTFLACTGPTTLLCRQGAGAHLP